jgi:hypothetical protein
MLYVPSLTLGLLSVSKLTTDGFDVAFFPSGKCIVTTRDNNIVLTATEHDQLYYLDKQYYYPELMRTSSCVECLREPETATVGVNLSRGSSVVECDRAPQRSLLGGATLSVESSNGADRGAAMVTDDAPGSQMKAGDLTAEDSAYLHDRNSGVP